MARDKDRKAAADSAAGTVVRFPPMPRLPRPPRLPVDPRQARTMHTLGALANLAGKEMVLAGPNFRTGYHASAVDLGALQTALARGVARLSAAQVEERWDEVLDWMRRVLRAWVQRYKHLEIERFDTGIRVEMETQDDHGYYTYGFDVFPGRRAPR